MENVSVKFQEDVLKRMDKCIEQNNFNSRTEFIREAVRDKLSSLSRDEIINEFLKFKGKSKIKTTDEDDRIVREQVSKEFLAELEERFK